MAERAWLRFGAALAEGRKEAGYPSQACLARATGMQAVDLCKFEGGVGLPSLRTFARLTGVGIDPLPLLAALDPEPATAEQGTAPHDEARPLPDPHPGV